MCFSAQASFTASGVLAVSGIACLHSAKRSDLPLAAMPLVFSIQQFCEGLVWLGVNGKLPAPWLGLFTYGFLFFAFVFWPAFAPLAVYRAEPITGVRKNVVRAACILGRIAALFFLYHLLTQPVGVVVAGGHLRYLFYYPYWLPAQLTYGFATIITPFFGRSRWLYVFGVLVGLGHFTARAYFLPAHPSAFCFFAALASGVLWLRIRAGRCGGAPPGLGGYDKIIN